MRFIILSLMLLTSSSYGVNVYERFDNIESNSYADIAYRLDNSYFCLEYGKHLYTLIDTNYNVNHRIIISIVPWSSIADGTYFETGGVQYYIEYKSLTPTLAELNKDGRILFKKPGICNFEILLFRFKDKSLVTKFEITIPYTIIPLSSNSTLQDVIDNLGFPYSIDPSSSTGKKYGLDYAQIYMFDNCVYTNLVMAYKCKSWSIVPTGWIPRKH